MTSTAIDLSAIRTDQTSYKGTFRALIGVYSTAEVDALIAGIGGGAVVWGDIGGTLSNQTDLQNALNAKASSSHTHSTAEVTGLDAALAGKQATLVSGTNIKTINGVSVLGSGDIIVSGGIGGSTGATDNRILRADGTGGSTLQNSAVTIDDSGNISGCNSITINSDVQMYRDAAAQLAIRNGTTAQGVRIYNTFTDASNYERLSIDWNISSNTARIQTQAAGTGASRHLELGTGASKTLRVNGFVGGFEIMDGSNREMYANWDGLGVRHDAAIGWSSSTALSQSPGTDVKLYRNSTGPMLSVRAAGGMQVRNLAGSADAPLTASTGTFSALVSVGTYTVGTLPSAASNAGAVAQVTDSSVTSFRSTVAGGGSTRVMVFSDGSNWVVV